MIFYSNSKDEILTQLKDTFTTYNDELVSQKQKLNVLLQILKNLNSTIQGTEDFSETDKITNLLKDLKSNIDAIRNNITNIQNFTQSITTLSNGLKSSPENIDLPAVLRNFNQIIIDSKSDIQISNTNFNNLILQYIKDTSIDVSEANTAAKEDTQNDNILDAIKNNPISDEEIKDNRVLLISEKRNKVFLPYYISDLKHALKSNKTYRNLQDVIDKQYIVSLNKYKNPPISRFREAYNLMRKKEKASISDSLDLALGLTFNSSLNPAIITACNNLEELESYLDCIELNELSKFEFFEIKYEISPMKK